MAAQQQWATAPSSQTHRHQRSEQMSSPDSVYSDTHNGARPRPPVKRQSTDNLLDYYQSAHAGQSYTPRTTRPLGPRAQGSVSSYYSTDSPGESPASAIGPRHHTCHAQPQPQVQPQPAAIPESQEDKGGNVSSPSPSSSFQQPGTAPSQQQTLRFRTPTVPNPLSFYGASVVSAMTTSSERTESTTEASKPPSNYQHPRLNEQALRQNLPITEPDSDFVASPRPTLSPKLHTPLVVQSPKKLHPVAEGIMTSPSPPKSKSSSPPLVTRSPMHRATSPANLPAVSDQNYVPGLHSTAGPLPNPPRHIKPTSTGLAPPPRPPRLHSPGGRRLHNPDAASSTNTSPSKTINLPPSASISPSPSRTRSPSPMIVSRAGGGSDRAQSSTPSSYKDEGKEHLPHVESPTAISPKTAPLELRRVHEHSRSQSESQRPPYMRASHSREGATTGEEEMQTEKALPSLASDWKLSEEIAAITALSDAQEVPLPVTTSQPAPEQDQSDSGPEVFQLDTHLDALKDYLPPMWRPNEPHIPVRDDMNEYQAIDDDAEQFTPLKKLSLNPPCLQFDELALLSSSVERIRAYTRKMQELTTYDTGLQDWMAYQKDRRTIRRKPTLRSATNDMDSISAMLSSPRKISHGSATSEITFPMRADAYMATDLSSAGHEDSTISTEPPSDIPYPSLLQGFSSRSNSSWSSINQESPRSNNFFSAMGKKASGKKGNSSMSGLTGLTSFASLSPVTNKLIRSPPIPPQPRPVNLPPAPLPGGPRARPYRTPSVIGNRTAIHYSSPEDTSATALSRSPSLPASPPRGTTSLTSDDFQRQVNRLADVLPHVDRRLLAGYLKHSGQDILAIGQYIEDEKHGKVHYEYLES